ncbi:hypothetical protein Scep_004585 [Stephania cephalantha]|uniref:Uncharacterized protein n=1 Tax=Stephania cephalantha TaxID=152367 RepID=A0AAP0KT02_9MAGN
MPSVINGIFEEMKEKMEENKVIDRVKRLHEELIPRKQGRTGILTRRFPTIPITP